MAIPGVDVCKICKKEVDPIDETTGKDGLLYHEYCIEEETVKKTEKRIAQAKAYEKKGNYDRAINLYKEMGKGELSSQAQQTLSQLKFKTGNELLQEDKYEDAIKIFTELGEDEYIKKSHFEWAKHLLEEGNYREAIKKFKMIELNFKIIGLSENECKKLIKKCEFEWAKHLLQKGKYKVSAEKFMKIGKFRYAGEAYEKMGNYKLAKKYYKKAKPDEFDEIE